MTENGSLSNLKILDFTGVLGPYAGKLYAGVGADVIHIEPITGDPLRNIGPFFKNIPGKDRSLQFLYYNAGKRGLALDINKDEGKDIFLKLCQSADLLLESFDAGVLNSMGLSFDVLSAVNPKLVQTSMTLFGATGPYANYPGSDLTCSALSGFTYLAGDNNDKPVRAPDDQAYQTAGAHAAVASGFALYFAKKTGIGQFVDIAAIESVASAHENAAQFWDLEGVIRRSAFGTLAGGGLFKCKDGYIALVAAMGNKNKQMWDPFVRWMKEEGVEGWEAFDDEKWLDQNFRRELKNYEIFCRIFEAYTMKHTKLELYEKGQFYKVATTPVSNGKDLVENPQLKATGFFQTVTHGYLKDDVTFPGAPYEFGEIQWRFGGPAPTLGQHTAEILLEVGYTQSEIDAYAKEGTIYVG
ncbi:MAG: CoA transferase [Desulfobacterales bacterium]|jgi:benzylsuccinate CoA-transferase BbsE subunit/naphthyl-2-methylsuccinate CoA transferase subunit|nr:CoA transferase [Desulfobacterales bacterium]